MVMTSADSAKTAIKRGCDRSGKSTQSLRLVDALKQSGVNAQLMRFPDRETESGKLISSYLSNKMNANDQFIHLLFSANRWEKQEEMRAALMGQTTLVVDRYSFSGVAYSAAKGLPFEWCKNPDEGLLAPDAVFFLRVDPTQTQAREGFGGERYEKLVFQTEVAKQFDRLKQQNWKIYDGTKSMDTLHSSILSGALDVIKSCSNSPLNTLWSEQ